MDTYPNLAPSPGYTPLSRASLARGETWRTLLGIGKYKVVLSPASVRYGMEHGRMKPLEDNTAAVAVTLRDQNGNVLEEPTSVTAPTELKFEFREKISVSFENTSAEGTTVESISIERVGQ